MNFKTDQNKTNKQEINDLPTKTIFKSLFNY